MALLISDGTIDAWGNHVGCGATRIADALLATARHCAAGSAAYKTVYAGASRQSMQPVGKGRKWIVAGRPESNYGRDVAFLLLEDPLEGEKNQLVVGTPGVDVIPAIVFAWDDVTPSSAFPTYSLTPHLANLLAGPLKVGDALPVRQGELYLLETIVFAGDSGTALLDETGALMGLVSRGLQRQDLVAAPLPPEDFPKDYVGAVWATLSGFCAQLASGEELLISAVVDWRLNDADPVWPTDREELAALEEIKQLCANLE